MHYKRWSEVSFQTVNDSQHNNTANNLDKNENNDSNIGINSGPCFLKNRHKIWEYHSNQWKSKYCYYVAQGKCLLFWWLQQQLQLVPRIICSRIRSFNLFPDVLQFWLGVLLCIPEVTDGSSCLTQTALSNKPARRVGQQQTTKNGECRRNTTQEPHVNPLQADEAHDWWSGHLHPSPATVPRTGSRV